jgi:uncharacterized membrane protein HdeD (DUF308 family)
MHRQEVIVLGRSAAGWRALGIALALVGGGLVSLSLYAARPPVGLIGLALLVGGGAQLALGYLVGTGRIRTLYLLSGSLDAAAGASVLFVPGVAASMLSLLAALLLILGGAIRISLAERLAGRAGDWAMAAGIVALVFGLMLFGGWSLSGIWFIGASLGLGMLLNGVATAVAAGERPS